MYTVRKVRTKSGLTAINVVQFIGHQAKIAKHIGSAKDEIDVEIINFIQSHYSFTIRH